MTRQEKQDFIATLTEMYKSNQFVFFVQMNGVNASNTLKFRTEARKNNAECVVAKNTLSKIVAKNIGLEVISANFSKQVLTVFTNEPVEIAKLLEQYADKGYSVIAGVENQSVLTKEYIQKLAKVPSMPVLRSMFLSTLLGVHSKFVRALSEREKSLGGNSKNDKNEN
jgi:large subunit ribosomal protein L10